MGKIQTGRLLGELFGALDGPMIPTGSLATTGDDPKDD